MLIKNFEKKVMKILKSQRKENKAPIKCLHLGVCVTIPSDVEAVRPVVRGKGSGTQTKLGYDPAQVIYWSKPLFPVGKTRRAAPPVRHFRKTVVTLGKASSQRREDADLHSLYQYSIRTCHVINQNEFSVPISGKLFQST